MPDQVQKLIEKLKSSDRDVVKASIIEELGNTGDHRALKPLVESLNDGDALVRWNAIRAVAGFGADSVALLFRTIESGDRFARRNVVQVLGEVGGEDVVDRLIRMLMFDESDHDVMIEIIRAMHKLRPERAVEPLITVLKMSDWEMRWRAINTLGHIGDPRALEPLLAVMEDEDPDIRWAAAIAVENIKNRALKRDAEPDSQPRASDTLPPASLPVERKKPARDLAVSASQKNGWTVVKAEGEMISTNSASFRSYVDGVVSVSSGPVEIDLSDCDFVDSLALGHFNAIRKKLKSKNRKMKISGMNPNLKQMFKATKLDELFAIE